MKPINLKPLLDAYEHCKEAKTTYERAKSGMSYYSESRVETAEQQLQKAEDTLCAERKKIDRLIREVEGRATVRRATAQDLVWYLIEINDKLSIPKTHMNGISARLGPNAQNFARSYKYCPRSTQFTCEYKNGTWRLLDIERGYCKRDGHATELDLTKEAEVAIVQKYRHWRYKE